MITILFIRMISILNNNKKEIEIIIINTLFFAEASKKFSTAWKLLKVFSFVSFTVRFSNSWTRKVNVNLHTHASIHAYIIDDL